MAVSPACVYRFRDNRIAGLGDGEAQSAELDDHWGQRGLGLGTRYRVLLVSGLPLVLEPDERHGGRRAQRLAQGHALPARPSRARPRPETPGWNRLGGLYPGCASTAGSRILCRIDGGPVLFRRHASDRGSVCPALLPDYGLIGSRVSLRRREYLRRHRGGLDRPSLPCGHDAIGTALGADVHDGDRGEHGHGHLRVGSATCGASDRRAFDFCVGDFDSLCGAHQ